MFRGMRRNFSSLMQPQTLGVENLGNHGSVGRLQRSGEGTEGRATLAWRPSWVNRRSCAPSCKNPSFWPLPMSHLMFEIVLRPRFGVNAARERTHTQTKSQHAAKAHITIKQNETKQNRQTLPTHTPTYMPTHTQIPPESPRNAHAKARAQQTLAEFSRKCQKSVAWERHRRRARGGRQIHKKHKAKQVRRSA